MEQTVVCSDCGIEAEKRETTMLEHREPCDGDLNGHSWSKADPMSRALARMRCSTVEIYLVDNGDNAQWQWFEVQVTDHDVTGGSELVADCAQKEGFSFVGIDSGDPSFDSPALRFNRKKGDD